MSTNPRKTPSWLPELTEQVQVALDQRTVGKVDQRPALEQELEQIRENVQGWNASLAKPKLPDAVRDPRRCRGLTRW